MKNLKHIVVFLAKFPRFLYFVAKSRGYTEWVDQSDGTITVDYWGYRRMLSVFRPRFNGFLKKRACGCSYRFGRKIYTLVGCEQHCPITRRRNNKDAA